MEEAIIPFRSDIRMKWSVQRLGFPEDFSNKELKVFLKDQFGYDYICEHEGRDLSYEINGNSIIITFQGRLQVKQGRYSIYVVENPDQTNQYTLCKKNAFILSDKACQCTGAINDNGRFLIDLQSDFIVPYLGTSEGSGEGGSCGIVIDTVDNVLHYGGKSYQLQLVSSGGNSQDSDDTPSSPSTPSELVIKLNLMSDAEILYKTLTKWFGVAHVFKGMEEDGQEYTLDVGRIEDGFEIDYNTIYKRNIIKLLIVDGEYTKYMYFTSYSEGN